jgi:predicted secreted protein
MEKVTQSLVIIAAACLLLAACSVEPSVITPGANEKSVSPTVGSVHEKEPIHTPTANAATISPTPGNPAEKTLVITRTMNGKSFTLHIGDSFEIQLATIPMTGFEWTPQNLDTTILLQQGRPIYTADTTPNSAGGIVTLRFKAVGAGKTHLTLLYLHAAENGLPALYNNSYGVTIEVK